MQTSNRSILRRRGASGHERRGSVLVMALLVLTLVTVLAMGLSQLSTRALRETSAGTDSIQALYLAEAGLGEAMTALRSGFSGAVGTPDEPAALPGGVFWVTSTPQADGTVLLESTALAGSGRAALAMVVGGEESEPLFQAVLNSKERLTMNSGVVVDSFDSALGSYASQATNVGFGGKTYAKDGGHISSNEDIVLNANAVVFGDATPGPGHLVYDAATGCHVSGSKAPAPTPFTFPEIEPPAVASSGPYSVPTGGSKSLGPGTLGFDDLSIGKDGKLTITGPATLVVNHFTGGKDAQLLIDATGGPVTIFVQGDYNHISGFSALPVGSSPMALAFMVQGGKDVVFPAQAKVRGAYYVPNAAVTFSSSSEAWGSFAARRIDMSSGMRFHYDEDLAKHWETNEEGGGGLLMHAWQRIAVASELMRDRRDPFQLLGLDPASLPAPWEAWLD